MDGWITKNVRNLKRKHLNSNKRGREGEGIYNAVTLETRVKILLQRFLSRHGGIMSLQDRGRVRCLPSHHN